MAKHVDVLRVELENTQMPKIRALARSQYNISASPTWTKEDFINEICKRHATGTYIMIDTGDLKPGHARIKIAKTQGDKNPPWVNVNGKQFYLPRGVEIQVPLPILEVLLNAKEPAASEDEDNAVNVKQEVLRFPMSVMEVSDEPLEDDSWTSSRDTKLATKKAFAEFFGHWPKNNEELNSALVSNPLFQQRVNAIFQARINAKEAKRAASAA